MSSKFKPWLVLAVIFVVGVLTGSALTIGLAPIFIAHASAGDSSRCRRTSMAHLTQRLNLTPDQQAKIQPILADARMRIQVAASRRSCSAARKSSR